MKIKILTLFPQFFTNFLETSIIKKGLDKRLYELEVIDIREYSLAKHKNTDDTIYGGGVGMLMDFKTLSRAITANSSGLTKRIITSPRGQQYNQEIARNLALEEDLLITCGHYEGFDERVYNFIDYDFSLGDFVLTGGELPAMVIVDSILRLLPGVVKGADSDSFTKSLLEEPQYTKPRSYLGFSVPPVLLSGHDLNIKRYRLKESLRVTFLNRPDLFKDYEFSDLEKQLLEEIIHEELS